MTFGFSLGGGLAVGVAGAVPVVSAVSYGVVDTAGGGQIISVTVDNSAGCTGITAGGVAFTSFAITDATHVEGRPGAHSAGTVDVVVTNATGPSTTGTGLIEYWSPTQITNVDAYFDANKGVTDAGAGAVSQWVDQTAHARTLTMATGILRPTQTASVFGTLPSLRFTPQQKLTCLPAIALTNGKSFLVVAKWTANVAGGGGLGMAFIADDTGDYDGFGTDATALGFRCYNTAGTVAHYNSRGSGLNDGTTRLVGITHDNTSTEKIYVGTTQQGTTISPGVVDDVAHAYSCIGNAYGAATGFNGDMGAVIVVDGVISGGDHTKLYNWAKQRFGAA